MKELENKAFADLEKIIGYFAGDELDNFKVYDDMFEAVKKSVMPCENQELIEQVIIAEEARIDASERYHSEVKKKEEDEAEKRRIAEEEASEQLHRDNLKKTKNKEVRG